MPQIKAIVIGTSPNQVTFNPVAAQRQVTDPAVLTAKDATFPKGSKRLEVMVRYPTGNQETERVKIKVDQPKTVTSDGIISLAYPTPYASVEFVFGQAVPAAERTALRQNLILLLQNVDIVDAIDNGSPLI